MKIVSQKTIYLSEDELKEALIDYLFKRGAPHLSRHLAKNTWDLGWSDVDKKWMVSMDGEFDDHEARIRDTKYALNRLGVHFGGLEEALNRHVWKKQTKEKDDI